jgi:uncharacterized membrane protein (DUF373 family)
MSISMTNGRRAKQGREFRGRTAGVFRFVEYLFYIAVAGALSIVGAIIFGNAVYTFISGFQDEGVGSTVLALLDQLLLVFIVAELIHTLRAVINDRVLMAEPFLIVGIVASIRRLIVVTAEVPRFIGTEKFASLMLEIGILVGGVLALGFTVFLLRHTEHPEPRPSGESETTQ